MESELVTDRPQVSVFCITYNHERFIRETLEGFVMQKTNFPFEVLIHDDASTDGTVKLIEEYVNKYPHIFTAICQKENQYSKGVIATVDILLPMAKGKYIALCEGDDYWCDKNKLQKQYEYMEAHEECSMCVHNSKIHYLDCDKSDELFNTWKEVRTLSEEEVFFGWNVHTSAYFMRKENMHRPDFARIWAGDYVMLTMNYDKGEIAFLPFVMSVYNANNKAGFTYQNAILKPELAVKKIQKRAEYLIKYNEYTDYRHDKIVQERILEIQLSCLICSGDFIMSQSKNYAELKNAAKEICHNVYYEAYVKRNSLKKRVKMRVKYNGHVWGYLWYIFILLNQRRNPVK